MKSTFKILTLISTLCFVSLSTSFSSLAVSEQKVEEAEPEKGPNRGRLLKKDNFAIELSIFETGVPPEFRVWATENGKTIDPAKVELNVKLTRLGDGVDNINFFQEGQYLRGDMVIYEPHSFIVSLTAKYQGKTYSWQYDNFEGRTSIDDKIAEAMEISTEVVGPSTFHESIEVFGNLTLPADASSNVYARFDGLVKKVHVKLGDAIKKGQLLLTLESNESLQSYQVISTQKGIVSAVNVTSGEQSKGRILLTVTNDETLVAELAVFPLDLAKINIGAKTTLNINGVEEQYTSKIDSRVLKVRNDQAKLFRVLVNNSDSLLSEGSFVSARIEIGSFEVAMAVKRNALQSFRDFTVVYAKVGNEYEVRMLELGRIVGDEIEVLGGISLGTEYVTENSYILKADVEKSGASHDH
ncbi:HlyD family efflux transporter periplasmic adaptor subunit [Colwellia sp. BRX8-4]|uniref:efflux RND transporter periplasmic adaptor subunit n=1 Tax=Colwellia sp. BRX8-4 TaxID=2759836 RepID=UPI0015F5BF7D|nr:HlyD family efflux transporter periplasmic adaptor subunit [Colwellia sp. BRX8-4]MBA6363304.1 HlyD family efflux transporter periplasmic adaptor subunit [Colwellia sp. BRX8-8]MBA6372452.1 HlyD family efflux transporter periplasmic adaptor subunit [Colwellia sp. BRX8-4]